MPFEKPSFLNTGGAHNFSGSHSAPVTPIVPKVSPSVDASAQQGGAKTKRSLQSGKIFDSFISLSLFALFFGLPIFFTGATFQGIAFEKQIYFYFWLLVGIVSWASKGVITGEMHIRRTPVDIFIVLFLAVYALSAFLSVDRWHSFWGFFGDPSRGVVSLTALALGYYLIMSHFTMRRFFLMFGGILASGFLVVLWSFLGLSNIKFLPTSIEQYAPISLIGTVSTLGIFLSLMVPLFITGIYLVWQQVSLRKSLRLAILGLLGLGLLGALYLMLALYPFLLNTNIQTGSLAWLVPLGGIAFFLVYILAQIVRPPEQLAWVPMFVFVVVLAFLMIGNNSLTRVQLPVEVAPNQSLSLQVAKESLKENFFLGVGPANYGYAFSQYRPDEYNKSPLYSLRFYQGTGVFFEALTTIGFIGTALLFVAWLSFLSVGLYLLSNEKEKNKYLSLGLWTVNIMLFIAAFSASVNGSLVLIGGVLSALSLALLFKESGTEERYYSLSLKASPKYALALAFIFMIVSAGVAFLFVFIGKAYLADAEVGQAARLSANGPQKESVALLGRAISKNPEEGRYYTRLGQENLGLLLTVEVKKSAENRDKDVNTTLYQQAIASFKEGVRRMPNDVLAVETLGLANENGVPYVTATDAETLLKSAFESYERASALEPTSPLLLIKQGQVKRLLADMQKEGPDQVQAYKDAEGYFEGAIAKKPDLASGYYNLSVVQSREKDVEGAIKSVLSALKYDSKNVNFKYSLGVLYQVRDKDGDKELAEQLFKSVLKENEKLVDVRLSLGLLYESWSKKDQALAEYRKIIELLPADGGDQIASTRTQVQKLISTLESGKSNITKSAPQSDVVAQPIAPTTPQAPVTPLLPTTPNESQITGSTTP